MAEDGSTEASWGSSGITAAAFLLDWRVETRGEILAALVFLSRLGLGVLVGLGILVGVAGATSTLWNKVRKKITSESSGYDVLTDHFWSPPN